MPKKITYNSPYKGLKINVNAEKGYGCHEQFLETYHQHLMDMCSKYSKVFQLRFDLRYPADNKFKHASYTPRQLSIFSENLTKDLKRNHPIYPKGANASQPLRKNPNKVDPRIIKVCEIGEKSDKTHIHGQILVNGNAKKCSSDLYARIERQWANALDIEFEDGSKIETVLMEHDQERSTVCVSSQVGCPLKCSFCATGASFKRNSEKKYKKNLNLVKMF